MEIFNLIPVGFLVWVIYKAAKAGFNHGYTERYFKETKHKTGKKFHNFFGIPNHNLE